MRIFITADYFLPGYKAGGPIRSLANFAQHFGRKHELFFFTRDRDATETESYRSVHLSAWNSLYGGSVYYASPQEITWRGLTRALDEVQPDCIYLNSLFSPISRHFMVSRSVRRVYGNCEVVLAVRGELNPGALALRPVRKKLYLSYLRASGACRDVRFQASSELEAVAIRQALPNADIVVASNIPGSPPGCSTKHDRSKGTECSFVFASRISPMKNLVFLLECFRTLGGEHFHLNIHGSVDDQAYWGKCRTVLGELGGKVTVHGAFRPDEAWHILSHNDFMVLPTLGENFGHSIYESAASGTPYIISDRTPWSARTESRAGWALSLDDKTRWVEVLRQCIQMDSGRYRDMACECRAVAKEVRELAISQHEQLFG